MTRQEVRAYVTTRTAKIQALRAKIRDLEEAIKLAEAAQAERATPHPRLAASIARKREIIEVHMDAIRKIYAGE